MIRLLCVQFGQEFQIFRRAADSPDASGQRDEFKSLCVSRAKEDAGAERPRPEDYSADNNVGARSAASSGRTGTCVLDRERSWVSGGAANDRTGCAGWTVCWAGKPSKAA